MSLIYFQYTFIQTMIFKQQALFLSLLVLLLAFEELLVIKEQQLVFKDLLSFLLMAFKVQLALVLMLLQRLVFHQFQ